VSQKVKKSTVLKSKGKKKEPGFTSRPTERVLKEGKSGIVED